MRQIYVVFDGTTPNHGDAHLRVMQHMEGHGDVSHFYRSDGTRGRALLREAENARSIFGRRKKTGLPLVMVRDGRKTIWACCEPSPQQLRYALTIVREVSMPGVKIITAEDGRRIVMGAAGDMLEYLMERSRESMLAGERMYEKSRSSMLGE